MEVRGIRRGGCQRVADRKNTTTGHRFVNRYYLGTHRETGEACVLILCSVHVPGGPRLPTRSTLPRPMRRAADLPAKRGGLRRARRRRRALIRCVEAGQARLARRRTRQEGRAVVLRASPERRVDAAHRARRHALHRHVLWPVPARGRQRVLPPLVRCAGRRLRSAGAASSRLACRRPRQARGALVLPKVPIAEPMIARCGGTTDSA